MISSINHTTWLQFMTSSEPPLLSYGFVINPTLSIILTLNIHYLITVALNSTARLEGLSVFPSEIVVFKGLQIS